jgi:hypothetical protein
MRTTLAAVAAIAALSSIYAFADGTSMGYEAGGQFVRFDPVVEQHNRSGERFRIVGTCRSACTLFLSIRNVCIEPGATFGFHAGHNRQRAITVAATSHMMSTYKPRLRADLLGHHAMDTLEFLTISGADMITKFGYRKCPT